MYRRGYLGQGKVKSGPRLYACTMYLYLTCTVRSDSLLIAPLHLVCTRLYLGTSQRQPECPPMRSPCIMSGQQGQPSRGVLSLIPPHLARLRIHTRHTTSLSVNRSRHRHNFCGPTPTDLNSFLIPSGRPSATYTPSTTWPRETPQSTSNSCGASLRASKGCRYVALSTLSTRASR